MVKASPTGVPTLGPVVLGLEFRPEEMDIRSEEMKMKDKMKHVTAVI